MFLLDTNVVSELRRLGTPKADAQFQRWADDVDLDRCFISVLTVMEIERGLMAKEAKDEAQGRALRAWFEQKVLGEFQGRILSVELSDARLCAALHLPHIRPENDTLLAATAKRAGLTVATRNSKDFSGLGVPYVNPWVA
ncbi:MAG: Toxin FitB [Stenotrophomonas maltophilia]|uniref:Toxin FitB n=1 Tax=Stenotrophomonas maltophilia TaxID=40324 RepID=A0A7V8JLV6_STEMA|nr:MAG: Toxin FitB [Stenotrophomonas maltophilia]